MGDTLRAAWWMRRRAVATFLAMRRLDVTCPYGIQFADVAGARCDWGEHDGEGVRGAIWFTTWLVVTCCMWAIRPSGVYVSFSDTSSSIWFSAEDPAIVAEQLKQERALVCTSSAAAESVEHEIDANKYGAVDGANDIRD